jgi:uncharacterized protein YbbK (DUF523 family)
VALLLFSHAPTTILKRCTMNLLERAVYRNATAAVLAAKSPMKSCGSITIKKMYLARDLWS